MHDATTSSVPITTNRAPLIAGAWLTLGTLIALFGPLRDVPQLAPAFAIASVIGWTLAYRRGGAVRAWVDAVPLRAVIAGHALRLPIGAAILAEGARGGVSPLFADRAGWGDMAVGVLAIAIALFAWKHRAAVRAFALFGLADILVAFGTAMYLLFGVRDAVTLDAITRMPWPTLPLMAVPMVITTHLLMFARTRRTPAEVSRG